MSLPVINQSPAFPATHCYPIADSFCAYLVRAALRTKPFIILVLKPFPFCLELLVTSLTFPHLNHLQHAFQTQHDISPSKRLLVISLQSVFLFLCPFFITSSYKQKGQTQSSHSKDWVCPKKKREIMNAVYRDAEAAASFLMESKPPTLSQEPDLRSFPTHHLCRGR